MASEWTSRSEVDSESRNKDYDTLLTLFQNQQFEINLKSINFLVIFIFL